MSSDEDSRANATLILPLLSSPSTPKSSSSTTTLRTLAAGAVAGLTVDLTLFPLDTLKTRLQSRAGFFASGGFRGVYSGLASVAVGSAPSAALFFTTYEGTKSLCARLRQVPATDAAESHAIDLVAAASASEIVSCAIRVPTELVKQRAQAGRTSSLTVFRDILRQRPAIGYAGLWMELYRGWSITIMREVPFTVIQFPLWEMMKRQWAKSNAVHGRPDKVDASVSALFGAISGGFAGAVTTPLDVLKTRLMLAKGAKVPAWTMAKMILKQEGYRAFLSGLTPRVIWISAGGAVFLGSYDWTKSFLSL